MTTQMTATPTGYVVTVPAGAYFLGDPCYAVPDDDWAPLLESNGVFGAERGVPGGPVGTVRGYQVLGFSTAYGDGEYVDQRGHAYPVDAGLIGLTPEALYTHPSIDQKWLGDAGRFVTFDYDVIATSDGEGRLKFGPYRIDTNDG